MYLPVNLDLSSATTILNNLWFLFPVGCSLIFSMGVIISVLKLVVLLSVLPLVCFCLFLEIFFCD